MVNLELMDSPFVSAPVARSCRFTLNGLEVEGRIGESILSAANRAGVDIPSMCADPRMDPAGECGLCMVHVSGHQEPVKACSTLVAEGLVVEGETPTLAAIRKARLTEYLSNHNAYCSPPCQAACPAGIDIAGYINLIGKGKFVEATALIKQMLPLPGILGRVCPRPCEADCRRLQIDGQPIAICSLKRYAADKAAESGLPTQPEPKPATGKRVAVIGAGPAGLSAAYYLAIEGHKVTLLEGEKEAGGTLRFGIPPYRLPDDVLNREIAEILSLGVELKTSQWMGRDYQIESLLAEGYDAAFLSVGAMAGKRAGIQGEDAKGVRSAIDYLRRINWGERVDLGRRVIVVGGGFTAADAVRTARRGGASEVVMMYRRTKNEMTASTHEIHDCELEGVTFEFLAAPVEVVVENGHAVGLRAVRMALGEPDESGRRRPTPVEGSEFVTPADSILMAIGQDVYPDVLNEPCLATNRWGHITSDTATMRTNLPGVFAGGDCSTGAATVVEAVAAGRKGACAIHAFLNGADDRGIAKAIERPIPKFFDIGATARQPAAMAEMPTIAPKTRVESFSANGAGRAFDEVELGFSDVQAQTEAERCLQCVCQAAGVCSLQKYSLAYDAGTLDYVGEPVPAGKERVYEPLMSWPFFELDRQKCVKCMSCVNICETVQHREVYTKDVDGYPALVSGTLDFRDTDCNNCGQCVSACPTGALKSLFDKGVLPKNQRQKTESVCNFCGTGCALEFETEGNKIVAVNASTKSPANAGNLCVKGRFGMDFIQSPDRLTKPLIRRGGKDSPFEEASWDEAIAYVARRLNEIKAKHGPHAIAGFTSARVSNEDDYVMQKLIRCAVGTNNTDHCARLCHMASVVALKQAIGSSAPSASATDIGLADVYLAVGSNPTVAHPVISSRVLRAKYERGAKIIAIDPRHTELVGHADLWLQVKPGTNVSILNSIAHVILQEGLVNEEFVEARTANFNAFAENLAEYSPEKMQSVTGVDPALVRQTARLYAQAERGILLWGMGITHHLKGVDSALALANLALMTGQVGRPGTGWMPLRGQANVQGASDMQGHHNALPGYQSITDPAAREKFEAAWGVKLPDNAYKSIIELEEAAGTGEIRAMYIMGDNAIGASPDMTAVEKGLRNLEFLVVQDIFMSDTAKAADVVLPAAAFAEKEGTFTNTERRVQLLNKAVDPPGEARPDWQIVCDISMAMGYPMSYPNAAAIMEEIASLVPTYAGIRHERLRNGGLQWPCPDTQHPGTRYLYSERFPTEDGRASFTVLTQKPAIEQADTEYPLIVDTGRWLEHYDTGTMTGRSFGLSYMRPHGEIEMHPEDAKRGELKTGDWARLSTRRGSIEARVRVSDHIKEGMVFYPFHYPEQSANRLVGVEMDSASRTPAFKGAAARIERIPHNW
ncbi:formate dehydrogenase subunit alpha [Methylocystis hirsuta]|nr:formate dehydrogenase subunit alpha [Methylocystis hirsuta]